MGRRGDQNVIVPSHEARPEASFAVATLVVDHGGADALATSRGFFHSLRLGSAGNSAVSTSAVTQLYHHGEMSPLQSSLAFAQSRSPILGRCPPSACLDIDTTSNHKGHRKVKLSMSTPVELSTTYTIANPLSTAIALGTQQSHTFIRRSLIEPTSTTPSREVAHEMGFPALDAANPRSTTAV
ncbi:hypothetical protein PG984_015609 [Apiospora sp. TS-2023a]